MEERKLPTKESCGEEMLNWKRGDQLRTKKNGRENSCFRDSLSVIATSRHVSGSVIDIPCYVLGTVIDIPCYVLGTVFGISLGTSESLALFEQQSIIDIPFYISGTVYQSLTSFAIFQDYWHLLPCF